MSLDFEEIRRLAEAAAQDLLDHRWQAYLRMVDQVEALAQNQDGADKSWVERAVQAHRDHRRSILRNA
jgi:hypothetical protein